MDSMRLQPIDEIAFKFGLEQGGGDSGMDQLV